MNYYEIPLPYDNTAGYNLNHIEGQHSTDDTVRICKYIWTKVDLLSSAQSNRIESKHHNKIET